MKNIYKSGEKIYTDPGQGLFTTSCPLYNFQIKYKFQVQ